MAERRRTRQVRWRPSSLRSACSRRTGCSRASCWLRPPTSPPAMWTWRLPRARSSWASTSSHPRPSKPPPSSTVCACPHTHPHPLAHIPHHCRVSIHQQHGSYELQSLAQAMCPGVLGINPPGIQCWQLCQNLVGVHRLKPRLAPLLNRWILQSVLLSCA